MNGRRALAALLSELADSAAALVEATGELPLRTRSLSLSLPIDLRVVLTEHSSEVLGDVPLFRTRTDFDPEPARLEVEWEAVSRAAEEAT